MEKVLKEMLDRATNPQNKTLDETSVEVFILVLRENSQLVIKCKELIFEKVRSVNPIESTKAVALLEICMLRSGSIEFENEMSKKRSLNFLTSLMLNEHEGENTPACTKQRILQCLHAWANKFPEKKNICIVYQSLNNKYESENGITPSSTVEAGILVNRRDNHLKIDEQQFIKLIKSENPKDLERANSLIKESVHQEKCRTELRIKQKQKLEEINNTVALLNQMVNTFEMEDFNNGDVAETIQVLNRSCEDFLKDDFNENFNDVDLKAEALQIKKKINDALQHYKIIKAVKSKTYNSPSTNSSSTSSSVINLLSTTNNANGVTSSQSSTTDILSSLAQEPLYPATTASLLISNAAMNECFQYNKDDSDNNDDDDGDLNATKIIAAKTNLSTKTVAAATSSTNVLDELNDIFSSVTTEVTTKTPKNTITSTATATGEMSKNIRDLFNMELLKPVKVGSTDIENSLDVEETTTQQQQQNSEKRAIRDLPEIDVLGEQLLKKNLTSVERIISFKKDPEKLTLNDLAKEKKLSKSSKKSKSPKMTSTISNTSVTTPTNDLPTVTECNSIISTSSSSSSLSPTSVNTQHIKVENQNVTNENDKVVSETEVLTKHSETVDQKLCLKSLSELNFALENVIPSGEERIIYNDDDIKIMLNFTKNIPSPCVMVYVFVIHNKSQLSLSDFQLEVSVKKPNKVRLLPATDTKISPYKLFPPSTPIYQMLLLLNPSGKSVDLTCLYGYKLGDDLDGIKDVVIAKNIPCTEFASV